MNDYIFYLYLGFAFSPVILFPIITVIEFIWDSLNLYLDKRGQDDILKEYE